MKKLSALIIAAILTLNCFAYEFIYRFPGKGRQQHWITAGLRGTFNSTWLLNKNMQDDEGVKYIPSWGYSGGIMLGFHCNNIVAVDAELLYTVYSQRFKDGEKDSLHWTARTDLAYIEIPLLLRFDFENYKYLEFGVRVGILNKATESRSTNNLSYTNKEAVATSTGDSYYEKKCIGLIFGWGGGIWGNGGALISGGLRFTYGLTDIIADTGGNRTWGLFADKGEDYYTFDNGTRNDYTPTNMATVGFHLICDFDIGWFVSSSCGRNHKFMMFSH